MSSLHVAVLVSFDACFFWQKEAATGGGQLKGMFLQISQKFTGKHLCRSFSILIKLLAVLKKRLPHRFFLVNFAKFLKTTF